MSSLSRKLSQTSFVSFFLISRLKIAYFNFCIALEIIGRLLQWSLIFKVINKPKTNDMYLVSSLNN